MKKNFYFLSKDDKTTIHATIWLPDYQRQPLAILQILHGMAEFGERYEQLAEFLNTKNIVVVAHDHLGHGYSVDPEKPLYGYFAENNGKEILIEDSWTITKKMKQDYPTLPCFLMGHSMGSFILRNYLKTYAKIIDGAIIMGSGGQKPGIHYALAFVSLLNRLNSKKTNNYLDHLAFGRYTKSFPENFSEYDWLSKNQENVQAFIEHPLMGFTFTNNGFYTLLELVADATQFDWFASINKNFPLYIISGEQDPVGNMGKGPRQIIRELEAAKFSDVTLQLYAQMRHEIVNEDGKELVYQDIYTWMKNRI